MSRLVQFSVVAADGSTWTVDLAGRNAWALISLIRAGDRGCTPIDNPGPRWSAYVFNLRQRGLDIETINELHGGPFKGTHARYVLRTAVHQVAAAKGATHGVPHAW